MHFYNCLHVAVAEERDNHFFGYTLNKSLVFEDRYMNDGSPGRCHSTNALASELCKISLQVDSRPGHFTQRMYDCPNLLLSLTSYLNANKVKPIHHLIEVSMPSTFKNISFAM